MNHCNLQASFAWCKKTLHEREIESGLSTDMRVIMDHGPSSCSATRRDQCFLDMVDYRLSHRFDQYLPVHSLTTTLSDSTTHSTAATLLPYLFICFYINYRKKLTCFLQIQFGFLHFEGIVVLLIEYAICLGI